MVRRSSRVSDDIPQESTPVLDSGRGKKRVRTVEDTKPGTIKYPNIKDGTTASTNLNGTGTARRLTPRTSQHFTSSAPQKEYDDATGLTSTDENGDDDDGGSDFSGTAAGEGPGKVTRGPASASLSDESDDEVSSEDNEPKRRKPKGKSTGKSDHARRKGVTAPGKVAETEVAYEDDLPEPGTEVVFKKPKARAPGRTPYQDVTIHPNTMLFLGELKQNNRREWLKFHDPDFRQSENDWKSFVAQLTEKLTEVDDEIPELPIKDTIYRIYRDVRFSRDPTPYKPFFSAAWSRTGRKGPYAAYYIQISPGKSFLGGGLWCPAAQALRRLRDNIDTRPEQLKSVLMTDRLRKEFLGVTAKNEKKVLQAFVSTEMNKEGALKTRPQGYSKDHVDIDLLRLRNFLVGRQLTDEEVVSAGFLDRVTEMMSIMKPFIHHLNSIVMPEYSPQDNHEDGDRDSDSDDDSLPET